MRFTVVSGGLEAAKHRKKLQNAEFWTRAAREWHKLYAPYVPMDTGRLYLQASLWEAYRHFMPAYTIQICSLISVYSVPDGYLSPA